MELRRWGKGGKRGKNVLRQWLQVAAGLLVMVAGWLLLLWMVGEIMSYPGAPGSCCERTVPGRKGAKKIHRGSKDFYLLLYFRLSADGGSGGHTVHRYGGAVPVRESV